MLTMFVGFSPRRSRSNFQHLIFSWEIEWSDDCRSRAEFVQIALQNAVVRRVYFHASTATSAYLWEQNR